MILDYPGRSLMLPRKREAEGDSAVNMEAEIAHSCQKLEAARKRVSLEPLEGV